MSQIDRGGVNAASLMCNEAPKQAWRRQINKLPISFDRWNSKHFEFFCFKSVHIVLY